MIFEPTHIQGVYIIDLEVKHDNRGGFARAFCKKEFEQIGHHKEFVQINHSYNTLKGTIRGMHFQVPPFKEIKLIRCVRGSVSDVVVDIREGSPTFLQHVRVELSAENKKMIYIPEGFAHGFQSLEDNSELIYHHTEFFTPAYESGLHYNDPLLGLSWELPLTAISEKDKNAAYLNPDFKGI